MKNCDYESYWFICHLGYFVVVNQGLATLAFFGVGVNLVLFLTRVMGQDNAEAANNVSKWTGTVYLFSLLGAFLSDSYWGRYLTCAIFQVIFVIVSILIAPFFPLYKYSSQSVVDWVSSWPRVVKKVRESNLIYFLVIYFLVDMKKPDSSLSIMG